MATTAAVGSGTLQVVPSALAQAAGRVRQLADQVRAESSASGRSSAGWRAAALDERLPGSRTAQAAARAGIALGLACDSLAAVLDGLVTGLARAAATYAETDSTVAAHATDGRGSP